MHGVLLEALFLHLCVVGGNRPHNQDGGRQNEQHRWASFESVEVLPVSKNLSGAFWSLLERTRAQAMLIESERGVRDGEEKLWGPVSVSWYASECKRGSPLTSSWHMFLEEEHRGKSGLEHVRDMVLPSALRVMTGEAASPTMRDLDWGIHIGGVGSTRLNFPTRLNFLYVLEGLTQVVILPDNTTSLPAHCAQNGAWPTNVSPSSCQPWGHVAQNHDTLRSIPPDAKVVQVSAGEGIFLPAQHYHAAANIRPTIAVAIWRHEEHAYVKMRGASTKTLTQRNCEVVVVGLGPNGLRALIFLKRAGIAACGLDMGRLGNTIRNWYSGSFVQGPLEDLLVDPHSKKELLLCCGVASLNRHGDITCGRDAYVRYLKAMQRKHRLLFGERAQVLGIQDSNKSQYRFELAIRKYSKRGDGTVPSVKKIHVRYVILALGQASMPKAQVGMPSTWIGHEGVQDSDYLEKTIVIVGSTLGMTASTLAISLCDMRASQVIMCDHKKRGDRNLHLGTLTDWGRKRYRVTRKTWKNEVIWYKKMRRERRRTLRAHAERGCFVSREECRVDAVNESHVRMEAPDGSLISEKRVDLVVDATGRDTDLTLLDTLNLSNAEVDNTTGETSRRGIFTIGFDVPGQYDHYGTWIYDNWLCWGTFAAESTSRAIATRLLAEKATSSSAELPSGLL